MQSKTLLRGRFDIQHFRAGKLIATHSFPNGIVDVGLNAILDTQFDSGTQITSWYLGFVDNAGFTAFSNADTMASHAGWTECTTYDEATRPQWNPGAAASRAITNGTPIDFTINATKTLKGVFLTSNNTKSGTTGVLWATAAFDTTKNVGAGDVLKVTYTVSG